MTWSLSNTGSMIVTRRRRVYTWSRQESRSRACSTLLTVGMQVSYSKRLPQHQLHQWQTWLRGWRNRAQFHVLSVRKHGSFVSHVSGRWQQGIDWSLKERRDWTRRHQKNALSKGPPQKPSVAMSSRAPSSAIAVAWRRTSPAIGCRVGSTVVLLQTSPNQPATVSLTSLCLAIGKPPLGQERACPTDIPAPQAQCVGRLAGVQPYLRARASRKAPLWRVRPYCSKGRADNQLEDPFSWANSMAFRRVGGKADFRDEAKSLARLRLPSLTESFARHWSS